MGAGDYQAQKDAALVAIRAIVRDVMAQALEDLALDKPIVAFDPDQPRDEDGQWTSGPSGGKDSSDLDVYDPVIPTLLQASGWNGEAIKNEAMIFMKDGKVVKVLKGGKGRVNFDAEVATLEYDTGIHTHDGWSGMGFSYDDISIFRRKGGREASLAQSVDGLYLMEVSGVPNFNGVTRKWYKKAQSELYMKRLNDIGGEFTLKKGADAAIWSAAKLLGAMQLTVKMKFYPTDKIKDMMSGVGAAANCGLGG